jgi:ribosomal protein S18 acetylase RimI-like enzyme
MQISHGLRLAFRAANLQDLAFCQALYFTETDWLIEKLGLNRKRELEGFAHQWVAAEVRVITVEGRDAGWLQIAPKDNTCFLKQLYLDRQFHNQGIGTRVMQSIIAEAMGSGHAVILGVAKINPARRLYERLGFHVTHEDEHKVYMRRDGPGP